MLHCQKYCRWWREAHQSPRTHSPAHHKCKMQCPKRSCSEGKRRAWVLAQRRLSRPSSTCAFHTFHKGHRTREEWVQNKWCDKKHPQNKQAHWPNLRWEGSEVPTGMGEAPYRQTMDTRGSHWCSVLCRQGLVTNLPTDSLLLLWCFTHGDFKTQIKVPIYLVRFTVSNIVQTRKAKLTATYCKFCRMSLQLCHFQ